MATALTSRDRTPASPKPSQRLANKVSNLRNQRPGRLAYLTLTAVVFFSAFPLYWSVVVASRDNSAIGQVPPPLYPGGHLFENIARVFDTVPFGKALFNSVVVSSARSRSAWCSSPRSPASPSPSCGSAARRRCTSG